MWEKYTEAKRKQAHQEALRGSVQESVQSEIKEGKEQMGSLKMELHFLSFYMCREEPQFVEEDIIIKSGFEGLSITTFDNPDSSYSGPFVDREEHMFYTVIPKLEELLPSLYLKKDKSKESPASDEEEFSNDETEMDIEREMKKMDETVTPEEEKPEPVEETKHTSEHISREVSVASITTATQQEKAEILMDRLLQCYSAEEVDKVCVCVWREG